MCVCAHNMLKEQCGEMACTSHPTVLQLPAEHKVIFSSPRLCFPSLSSLSWFEIHCANELWDYKQDNNHGAWSNLRALVLRGRDSWGNHRLWVPACALQNQSLTEKCHGESAGPSYTTRKLSIVLP